MFYDNFGIAKLDGSTKITKLSIITIYKNEAKSYP